MQGKHMAEQCEEGSLSISTFGGRVWDVRSIKGSLYGSLIPQHLSSASWTDLNLCGQCACACVHGVFTRPDESKLLWQSLGVKEEKSIGWPCVYVSRRWSPERLENEKGLESHFNWSHISRESFSEIWSSFPFIFLQLSLETHHAEEEERTILTQAEFWRKPDLSFQKS